MIEANKKYTLVLNAPPGNNNIRSGSIIYNDGDPLPFMISKVIGNVVRVTATDNGRDPIVGVETFAYDVHHDVEESRVITAIQEGW